ADHGIDHRLADAPDRTDRRRHGIADADRHADPGADPDLYSEDRVDGRRADPAGAVDRPPAAQLRCGAVRHRRRADHDPLKRMSTADAVESGDGPEHAPVTCYRTTCSNSCRRTCSWSSAWRG